MVKLLPLNGHVLVRCHRRFNHNQSSSLSLSFKPCFFNPIIFLQNLKTLLSVTSIERSYLWSLHVCLGLTSPLLETSCPMITTIGLDSPLKSMSIWWESGSRKRNIDYHLDTWTWGWFFHLIIIHLINLCIAQKILKKSNLTNYVKK